MHLKCAQCVSLSEMMMKIALLTVFFFFLFCFSPPRTPVKVVPQIRLELEPEDNDDPGRNKGTETTL